MADIAQKSTAASQENEARAWASSLGEAVIASLLSLVLFSVLIGFRTKAAAGGLELTTRWGLAIALAIAVGVLRLIFDLFVWRRLIRPQALFARLSAAARSRLVIGAVIVLYLAGAVIFFVPGAHDSVVETLTSPFALLPAIVQSKFRILFSLFVYATLGLFLIGTGMIATRLLRFAAGRFRGATSTGAATPTAEIWGMNALTPRFADFAPGLLLVALALPMLVTGAGQRYALDTAIQVLTYIMLGWGLNVVVGLAGLLDLGYVAFYAVGAYSFALISTEFGWSFWACLPLAGFFAALWGVILGFPVLRLRGDYLAIVTLAFGEIIRIVLLNWYSLTNGPDGISRIPKVSFFGLEFSRFGEHTFSGFFGIAYNPLHRIIFLYYVILVLALVTNFVTMRLRRLPIGRAWEALREDEIACRTLGINTTITKLTAFATGAMFGGFAGSFFATRQGFISPESFTFQESALVLAIVVLGGLGSQIGVVIAAVVLIGSSEFFRDLEQYRMLIFGASMVTIMVWRPRGLIAVRTPSIALKERKAIAAEAVAEGKG